MARKVRERSQDASPRKSSFDTDNNWTESMRTSTKLRLKWRLSKSQIGPSLQSPYCRWSSRHATLTHGATGPDIRTHRSSHLPLPWYFSDRWVGGQERRNRIHTRKVKRIFFSFFRSVRSFDRSSGTFFVHTCNDGVHGESYCISEMKYSFL